MKNKFFIGLIGVMLVIGCVCIGCDTTLGGNTNDGNDKVLIGTWKINDGMSLTFTADTWSIANTQYSGSYTAKNGNMTITGMEEVISGNYSITGDTLTLTNFPAESQLNGSYTKDTTPNGNDPNGNDPNGNDPNGNDPNGNDPNGNDGKLIGTWQSNENGMMLFTFTAETMNMNGGEISYTANNGNITFDFTNIPNAPQPTMTGNYVISDNGAKLEFTNFPADFNLNGTYTKIKMPAPDDINDSALVGNWYMETENGMVFSFADNTFTLGTIEGNYTASNGNITLVFIHPGDGGQYILTGKYAITGSGVGVAKLELTEFFEGFLKNGSYTKYPALDGNNDTALLGDWKSEYAQITFTANTIRFQGPSGVYEAEYAAINELIIFTWDIPDTQETESLKRAAKYVITGSGADAKLEIKGGVFPDSIVYTR